MLALNLMFLLTHLINVAGLTSFVGVDLSTFALILKASKMMVDNYDVNYFSKHYQGLNSVDYLIKTK